MYQYVYSTRIFVSYEKKLIHHNALQLAANLVPFSTEHKIFESELLVYLQNS